MGEKFGQCQNFLFFTGKQGRLFSSFFFFAVEKWCTIKDALVILKHSPYG